MVITSLEFATGKTDKCQMVIQTGYMFRLLTGYWFSRRCF